MQGFDAKALRDTPHRPRIDEVEVGSGDQGCREKIRLGLIKKIPARIPRFVHESKHGSSCRSVPQVRATSNVARWRLPYPTPDRRLKKRRPHGQFTKGEHAATLLNRNGVPSDSRGVASI